MSFFKKDKLCRLLGPWTNEALCQTDISVISSFMICFRHGSQSINATRAVFTLGELCKRLMQVYFEDV